MSKITKLSSFQIVKRRGSDQAPALHTAATDLEVVVDKSGSMSSMSDVPSEQIHQLIKDQRKLALDEQRKIYLSLTVFDTAAITVINNVDLSDPNYVIPTFAELKTMLYPSGLTRFYDTILERVASQKGRAKTIVKALPYSIRSLNPKVNKVLYCLTDGEDNQSTMGMTHIRQCLNTQKALGYFTAVFLAANIGDAEVVGEQLGFGADTSLTIGNTPQYAQVGMNHANSLLRAVSSGAPPPPFTQSMRQSSAPAPPPAFGGGGGGRGNHAVWPIPAPPLAYVPSPLPPPPSLIRSGFAPVTNLRQAAQGGRGCAGGVAPPPRTRNAHRYNLRRR